MKKNISFGLSVFALVVFVAGAVPASQAVRGACDGRVAGLTTTMGKDLRVSTAIASDTLATVSGISVPLRIGALNEGDSPIKNGSIVVTIVQEGLKGDTAAARYVAKKEIDLAVGVPYTSEFTWNVPPSLPTGLYRITADFVLNGKVYGDTSVISNSPFGNDAKVHIEGDSGSLALLGPIVFEDFEAQSTQGESACESPDMLYMWSALIGGLGALMIVFALLIRKRHDASLS